jgi:hypothetical protein
VNNNGPFTDVTSVFPNNAVSIIAYRIKAVYPEDLLVVKRPLKITDASQTVGVYPSRWDPQEDSFEFKSLEPTIQRYRIGIQVFAKDTDEEKGIAVHSVMSKAVRSLLYNDVALNVGFNALSVTMNGSTERIQRRGFSRAQYISNEVNGQWLYLATHEYWIETETK